jgi:hypothetical protein
MTGPAIIASKKCILAGKGIRPDRPLDHVGDHLDAAVFEEHRQAGPVSDGIANGLGQIRDGRDAADVIL